MYLAGWTAAGYTRTCNSETPLARHILRSAVVCTHSECTEKSMGDAISLSLSHSLSLSLALALALSSVYWPLAGQLQPTEAKYQSQPLSHTNQSPGMVELYSTCLSLKNNRRRKRLSPVGLYTSRADRTGRSAVDFSRQT